jgi:TolB-like protein/Tfp pilus assembly protein PilF
MTQNVNRISRFWQELKRRRVIHVITVYASASFVIIELIGNLSEPLHLPTSLSTILIIVLAAGFPLAIILSWLYDLTSRGLERTETLEEGSQNEKPEVPSAWKIATYVSFIVILGLVTFNIMGGAKQLRSGDIQSLIILPFDNFTGDNELENVVSGMHALLVGDMGRIGEVRVLGGTTSNTFKGADMTASEIAAELNVDAILEGSVMCFGDTVCMQFRLVQTTGKEKQLWVADYTEDKGQMLNLNNRITREIAQRIKIELSPEEERILAESRNVDREAYDAFVNSYMYWSDLSRESLHYALEYLHEAVEKDPEFAPLYAGLAQVWVGLAQMGYAAPEEAGPKIFTYLEKALELAPDFTTSHFVSAAIAVWTEWNWDKGEKEFLKALELNPNDAVCRIYYAHLLQILRRWDEAHFHSQMAYELDPMNPKVLALSAMIDFHGRPQLSLEKSIKALEINPDERLAQASFRYSSLLNGDFENSIKTLLKFRYELNEEAREAILSEFSKNGHTAAIEVLIIHLEEYARNNYMQPVTMAEYHHTVGKHEKAIEYYVQAFELHDPMLPYFTTPGYGFDDIKDDPRIVAIVKKMNFPSSVMN